MYNFVKYTCIDAIFSESQLMSINGGRGSSRGRKMKARGSSSGRDGLSTTMHPHTAEPAEVCSAYFVDPARGLSAEQVEDHREKYLVCLGPMGLAKQPF